MAGPAVSVGVAQYINPVLLIGKQVAMALEVYIRVRESGDTEAS